MTKKEPTYIETVAPTPHWGDDTATMEGLIRARLAEAQRLFEWQDHRMHTSFKFVPGDESPDAQLANSRTLVSMFAFLSQAVEAHLLMKIQELSPDTADQFARDHIGYGESGDYYPEMLWDWLEARGIDPEKIRAEAKAEIAKETPAPELSEAEAIKVAAFGFDAPEAKL